MFFCDFLVYATLATVNVFSKVPFSSINIREFIALIFLSFQEEISNMYRRLMWV